MSGCISVDRSIHDDTAKGKALDVLKDFKNRGEVPKIVSEVKCSQVLFDTINANGGVFTVNKNDAEGGETGTNKTETRVKTFIQ